MINRSQLLCNAPAWNFMFNKYLRCRLYCHACIFMRCWTLINCVGYRGARRCLLAAFRSSKYILSRHATAIHLRVTSTVLFQFHRASKTLSIASSKQNEKSYIISFCCFVASLPPQPVTRADPSANSNRRKLEMTRYDLQKPFLALPRCCKFIWCLEVHSSGVVNTQYHSHFKNSLKSITLQFIYRFSIVITLSCPI